jgi:signal transduction histidine kinase
LIQICHCLSCSERRMGKKCSLNLVLCCIFIMFFVVNNCFFTRNFNLTTINWLFHKLLFFRNDFFDCIFQVHYYNVFFFSFILNKMQKKKWYLFNKYFFTFGRYFIYSVNMKFGTKFIIGKLLGQVDFISKNTILWRAISNKTIAW